MELAGRTDEEFLRLIPRDLTAYDPAELMAIVVRAQDRIDEWARLAHAVMAELALRWPGVVREIKERTGLPGGPRDAGDE